MTPENIPKRPDPEPSPEGAAGIEEELGQILSGARCILWHALVHLGPDGKPVWKIRVFNEEGAEQLHPLRRRPDQSYSDVWQAWTHPEDRRRIDETSERALRTGASGYAQEFRSQRADGEMRWLYEQARIQPLGPDRWRVIGVCTDITDRKRMEEALRLSEARYRAVVEDHTDLICRCRPDGTLTFVNDAFASYFGRPATSLVGQGLWPLVHEEDRERLRNLFAHWEPTTPVVSGEQRALAKDGSVRWHHWVHRAIRGPDGQVVEIQSVGRDVTAQKEMEARQRAASEGLRTVVAIADHLLSCPDLDTLCRRAVELLRERLGVERCAIFLRQGDELVGTYGTDRRGCTTDEHKHRFPATREWIERIESLRLQERRMLVVRQRYHEWIGDRTVEFGHGWVAITPIMSTREFVGVFCNDSAITGAPMDETLQEIISVFCSLLGAIIERRRIEDQQQALSAGLMAVLSVADQLMACEDVDTLCRRAVELAREKLGVERGGLFLRAGDRLRATYGTDREGHVIPEHGHEVASSQEWMERFETMRREGRRWLIFHQRYVDWRQGREERFGYGWVAATPIQSPAGLAGVFFNDAAISGAPVDETRQELLAVYSSFLGALLERKGIESRLRATSQGLRAVVEIADEMIACADLDAACRVAVERAREKLGLERCGLFLVDGHRLRGTYGTNRRGETTDEHDHLISEDEPWLVHFRELRPAERRTVLVEQPYVEWEQGHAVRFGRGWVAVTPIQSAREFIGVFCNDAAISGAPLDPNRQEIVSVFCSTLGAVIEGKRAEAETRRLAMAIQQEAEAVIITDPAGTIQYVNPAFERMTGYESSEVLGRNPRILKSGRQDAAFYRAMWASLAAGQPWAGRLINRKKDGSLYEVEITISPIRDAAGRIVHYVATSRDITREVELEQEMRQAQKMEAVGRLAGGIAHDFNNLLTSILGFTRLVQDQLGDGHPVRGDLEEIVRAGERAAALTKQLLAFSRKHPVEARRTNLNAVVAEMDRLLRRTLGEHIELHTVAESETAFVRADPGLLEQVIMNLALNARDAMPRGGSLTIRTAEVVFSEEDLRTHLEARPGRYVLLSTRDTGVGMSPEVREHCFEPFFTSKPAGEGTGLGLSIVYSIVKQCDGFIELDTAPGAGTEVRVYLPAAEAPAETAPSAPPVELPRGDETILVVEDEDTVRHLAARILRSLGYQVLEAAHAGEAVLLCERHRGPLDLVLADVVMPHLRGPELIERLRRVRDDFDVLYMSGFAEDSFVREELGAGSPRFLPKPFTHEALALKVRAVLDEKARAERRKRKKAKSATLPRKKDAEPGRRRARVGGSEARRSDRK